MLWKINIIIHLHVWTFSLSECWFWGDITWSMKLACGHANSLTSSAESLMKYSMNLPSMSWVSSTDVPLAVTSRGGTAATGTQRDKLTLLHIQKTHFVHYDSLLMKHRFTDLNSCFISCATSSDATESKATGESLMQK